MNLVIKTSEGRSAGYSGKYDKKQLRLGVKIEAEHSDNPKVAEKIAKDHLAEIKDYYTRLIAMEQKARKESK